MAFGISYESGAGDIVPVLKFDARAGRFFRVDRADGQLAQDDAQRIGAGQFAGGQRPHGIDRRCIARL